MNLSVTTLANILTRLSQSYETLFRLYLKDKIISVERKGGGEENE